MQRLQGRQWQQSKTLVRTPAIMGTPALQQKLPAEIAGKKVTAEKDTCMQGLQWQQGLQLYNRNSMQRLQERKWQQRKTLAGTPATTGTPALQQPDSDSRERHLHGLQRQKGLQVKAKPPRRECNRQWQQGQISAGTPALQQKLHAEIGGKTVSAEKDTTRDSSDNKDSRFTAETPWRDCREDSASRERHLQGLQRQWGLQLYSRNSMQRLLGDSVTWYRNVLFLEFCNTRLCQQIN